MAYLIRSLLLSPLLILLVLSSAVAQKIDTEKEDVNDPENTICTTWESFYQSAGWKGSFRVLDQRGKKSLEIKIFYTSGEEIFIDKDQELIVAFANETHITLKAAKDGKTCDGCGSTGMMGRNKSGVNAEYRLNDEAMQQLSSNDIYSLKIFLRTGSLAVDLQGIKSMFAKNIRQAVELIEAQKG